MKAAILFPVLSLIVGSAIGATVAYQQYGWPVSEFGPFSSARPLAPDDAESYLSERRVAGKPQLEVVGGPQHDFGVMRRNAESRHAFTIKNVGTAPLEMAVVGSTCKCTVGKLEQQSLAPGETTQVNMEWTAKTMSRQFRQSASLQTNDPTAGEVQLIVEGLVVDLVDAEPQAWNVGDIEANQPIELQTTLYNHADEPIEITAARWADEAFDKLSEVDFQTRPVSAGTDGAHAEATEAIDVKIRIAPGTRLGPLHRTLRIHYRTAGGSEDHPPLELVLTGRVVGPLSLLGGSQLGGRESGRYVLNMGRAGLGEPNVEKIHVVLRGEFKDSATLRVGQVEPAEALEAELGKPTSRGSMTLIPLEVRVRPDAPEMERTGKTEDDYGLVVVESDNPEVAPIRLKVTFRVGTAL